jgi:hypothetical protein
MLQTCQDAFDPYRAESLEIQPEIGVRQEHEGQHFTEFAEGKVKGNDRPVQAAKTPRH